MTVYVGGIRDRLIHDSMFYTLKSGLTALGWFATNPTGFKNPVNMIPEQVEWDVEIPLNSITVAPGATTDEEWELGTFGMKNIHEFYVDIYGENEALGSQLSGDVRDILRGKFPDFGFSQPTLNVLDYTMATPAWIFYCDIEHVTRQRATDFTHKWQRYLFEIRCEVIDYYANSDDVYYVDGADSGAGTDPSLFDEGTYG
jgi:hypothetical protein